MLSVPMFGVGSGEMLMLAMIVLVVVGPAKMPVFMKTVGKTLRQFRAASKELRRQSGIDEMMREPVKPRKIEPTRDELNTAERKAENPSESPDLVLAKSRIEAAKAEAVEA